MGAVSLFTDEEKKFKSQNWYEAKLRQRMGKPLSRRRKKNLIKRRIYPIKMTIKKVKTK